MGFSSEYIDQGRGLVFRGDGALTTGQIIDTKRMLLGDPERLRRVVHAVISLEAVTDFPSNVDEIRQLADVDREFARLIPRAVVAVIAPTDLPYGMARMWQMLSEEIGWTTSVFRGRAEAESWLALTLAARGASTKP